MRACMYIYIYNIYVYTCLSILHIPLYNMCVYVALCSIYLLYQHLFSWDVDGPSLDTHQKMMTTGHLYFGGPSTPKKKTVLLKSPKHSIR